MKALVLDEKGIECKDVPEPIPGPGYVKIKVSYCGICGSDIPRVLEGTAHHYPLILGHEFSGIVCDLGANVNSLEIGDKVVGIPLIPCFQCDSCRRGLYSLCSDYSFIGSRIDGGYAEYVCVSEDNVLKLDDGINLLNAATIEPCTIARHAFCFVDVTGKNVAIIGNGIIGMFAVQWAKIKGASRITLITHNKGDFDIGVVGSDEIIERKNVRSQYEVIIDCAGTEESIKDSLVFSRSRASIIYIGTPKTTVLFSKKEWEIINRKELNIQGSWMSYSKPFPGEEWCDSVEAFKQGRINVNQYMISSVIRIQDAAKIFGNINDIKRQGRIIINLSNI